MIMKPYLKIELIEGREELCDRTNTFVCNVDAVGHLGKTKMTEMMKMIMKIVKKMMTMMMSMLTKIFTLPMKMMIMKRPSRILMILVKMIKIIVFDRQGY